MKHILRYHYDQTLAYAEYGDAHGFPILIQHGLIASITDAGLFDRLVQLNTRLICIARPGYGESSPYLMKNIGEWGDIVSILVEKLELTQFDVMGMSSGAPYSYATGWKLAEQVRKIYIFSGTPALYADEVLSHWPYPVNQHARMAEMETLAQELFFSHLSDVDLRNPDVQDSMRNHGFGVAQDLKLRCVDWGFTLAEVKARVLMQHSLDDPSVPFITALLTSQRLPHCELVIKENDVHFSKAALDDFIESAMKSYFEK